MKLKPFAKVTILHQLILHLAWAITLRVSATLPSLVKIVSAVAPPRGGEIYGSRAFYYCYFLFLSKSVSKLVST